MMLHRLATMVGVLAFAGAQKPRPPTLEVERTFAVPRGSAPEHAVLTGDGQFAAVIDADSRLHVWSVRNGQVVKTAEVPWFSTLISAPWTPDLIVWRHSTWDQANPSDVRTPAALEHWRLGATPVLSRSVSLGRFDLDPLGTTPVHLSPGGRRLITCRGILDLDRWETVNEPDSFVGTDVAVHESTSRLLSVFNPWCCGAGESRSFLALHDGTGRLLKWVESRVSVIRAVYRPRGDRILLITPSSLQLVDNQLVWTDEWAVEWQNASWLDNDWVLGSGRDGKLALLHVGADTPVRSLGLPSAVADLEYYAAPGLVLATLQDRIALLRVRR